MAIEIKLFSVWGDRSFVKKIPARAIISKKRVIQICVHAVFAWND